MQQGSTCWQVITPVTAALYAAFAGILAPAAAAGSFRDAYLYSACMGDGVKVCCCCLCMCCRLLHHQQQQCMYLPCRFSCFGCSFLLQRKDRDLVAQWLQLHKQSAATNKQLLLLQAQRRRKDASAEGEATTAAAAATTTAAAATAGGSPTDPDSASNSRRAASDAAATASALELEALVQLEGLRTDIRLLQQQIRAARRGQSEAMLQHEAACKRRLVKCACCLKYVTLEHAKTFQDWATVQQQQELLLQLRTVAATAPAAPPSTGDGRTDSPSSSSGSAAAAAATAAAPAAVAAQGASEGAAEEAAPRPGAAGAGARGAARVRYFPLLEPTARSCLFASQTSELGEGLTQELETEILEPFAPALRHIGKIETQGAPICASVSRIGISFCLSIAICISAPKHWNSPCLSRRLYPTSSHSLPSSPFIQFILVHLCLLSLP